MRGRRRYRDRCEVARAMARAVDASGNGEIRLTDRQLRRQLGWREWTDDRVTALIAVLAAEGLAAEPPLRAGDMPPVIMVYLADPFVAAVRR
jgi:hypothetical protein